MVLVGLDFKMCEMLQNTHPVQMALLVNLKWKLELIVILVEKLNSAIFQPYEKVWRAD